QIEALRKQIEAGNKSTEEFWRQLEQKHAPLVESTEDDKQHQFVTFLWRGTPNTRNVLVLFYPFAANQTQDYEMRQLADSNVWYLTIRLPSGARFAYQLSPNDPLTFQGPDAFWRDATAQADPLNPHRWQCASDASKFDCQSMVELPGAVQQPWIDLNPSTPAGKVERLTIKSSFLKSERNIAVYTPAGYRAEHKAYALLVVFDEDAYLTLVPTPVILDNLIAASKIEPTVAVLIGEPDLMARLKDLECNREFTDFLGRELTPWMHAHYNVTTDPRETIIGGSSLGGIAATYAALRYPEIFGNVLSQSGAFWWAPDHNPGPDAEASTETGWLAKQFLASPKLPLRFYMDAGVFEGDFRGRGFDILGPTRHMRDVLVAKGYEVHYQQFVGGHDYLNWRGTLADGLLALSSR
ncbi:MAG TPA: enterochelin esterase, partial [Silvibacterium sp.]|nr:enterochelin esterase [Silvibacterium sp.]